MGAISGMLLSTAFSRGQRKRHPILRRLDGKQVYLFSLSAICLLVSALLMFWKPKTVPSSVVEDLETQLRVTEVVPRVEEEFHTDRHTPSPIAVHTAQQIPEDAPPYALALKATAERRFHDAWEFLEQAEKEATDYQVKIRVGFARVAAYEGRLDDAVSWYDKARQLAPADLAVLSELAIAFSRAGKPEEAQSLTERLLASRRSAAPDSRDTLVQLNNLAFLLLEAGDTERAEHYIVEAQSLSEELFPDARDHLAAVTISNLGWLYSKKNQHQDALRHVERALDIERGLPNTDPLFLADLYNTLGIFSRLSSDLSKADNYYKRALAIYEKEVGRENLVLGHMLNNLAVVGRIDGRLEDAQRYLERSLEITRSRLGEEHPDLGIQLTNFGRLLEEKGDYEGAALHYREALTIFERRLGVDHPQTARALNHLGALLHKQRELEEAEVVLRRALTIREALADQLDLSETLNNLGALYLELERYSEAEPLLRRTLAIRQEIFQRAHPRVAIAMNNLASLYRLQGRLDEASRLWVSALTIVEETLGVDSPVAAGLMVNLGDVTISLGEHDEGLAYLKRALDISDRALGSEHPRTRRALQRYIGGLEHVGLTDEARRLREGRQQD